MPVPEIPGNLHYTADHLWLERGPDGVLKAGLTDYGQNELGDIVFVDLPQAGTAFGRYEECVLVESVRTTTAITSPLSGVVIDTNQQLEENPELINIDPYGDGWLFLLKPADAGDPGTLVDAGEYSTMINQES